MRHHQGIADSPTIHSRGAASAPTPVPLTQVWDDMDPGPLARRALFTLVSMLVLGSVSLREYSRFPRGDSFANLFVPTDSSRPALIVVFVVIPTLASILVGIAIAREVERS